MNRWQPLTDQDGRSRLVTDRVRRQTRPSVESLEGRTLLSTVQNTVVKTHPAEKAATPAPPKPKFPPYSITARVSLDSNPTGGGQIFQPIVEVDGKAGPYSTVWLAQGLHPGYFTNIASADYLGDFSFLIPVGTGTTTLQVFAENGGLDYSRVADVEVTRGNVIEAWDSIALSAIRTADLTAPEAARDLAILHAAQYDAVAAIEFPNQAYEVHIAAPKGASAEAAADTAALTVLSSLFPSQASTFSEVYNAAFAGFPSTNSVREGLALGKKVGAETIADRANDGSIATSNFAPSNVSGLWRPTSPSFLPAINPQFGQVTPFEISSGSAFRPPAPPALGTSTYDQALAQVASLGGSTGSTRTPDQTAAALFWADGSGTNTDPGHWNKIAEEISLSRNDSLAADARLFAELDFALADAAIASSDSQYTYDEWRPISAIQQTDPTFTSLVTTPASPSYVSDSAAYGAAASEILTAAFGSNVHFTDHSEGSGTTRTFTSFVQAAAEDANSRIWGGVNFSFDATAGVSLGNQVGQAVLAKFVKSK